MDANGIQHCQLECKGVYHVKRAADLKQLQDCVSINGSLIIELVDIKGGQRNLIRIMINDKKATIDSTKL